MNHNRIKLTIFGALVAGTLAASGALATDANAAIDARVRVSIPGGEIAFRTTPRWVVVPGTQVYVVREDMRPRQDFFRYKGWYYVYDHGNWYRSHRWNGRYVFVRQRDVPRQFWSVPRTRWRNGWNDRDDWRADRRDDRDDRWDDRSDRRDDRDGRWDDRDDHRGSW